MSVNHITIIYVIYVRCLIAAVTTTTDLAQNLELEIDKDFNFKKLISNVCQSRYYHICDLCQMLDSSSDNDNCNVTCG